MKLEDIKLGHTYKIYDTRLNNALIYSAAQFERIDKNGNKFILINTPNETPIWFKDGELQYLTFTKSFFIK